MPLTLQSFASGDAGSSVLTKLNVNMVAIAAYMPTGVVVGTTDSQTLTNKTITAPIVNTIGPNGSQQHTIPAVASDTVALIAAAQTLTNKTLTAPVITSPVIQSWSGWQTVPDSWSYASSTTITVPSGAASIYQIGDKIKITQTTDKFFIVTAVADTLLTVTGGSDYSVANAAITSPYISRIERPFGWPGWFNYACTGPTGATITARFTIHGRTAEVIIRGAVTGAMSWASMPSVPIACSANAGSLDSDSSGDGVGGYLDSGTINSPAGLTPSIGPNDTSVRVVGTATSVIVSATSPITWANGDTFYLHFSYEF